MSTPVPSALACALAETFESTLRLRLLLEALRDHAEALEPRSPLPSSGQVAGRRLAALKARERGTGGD